MHTEQMSRIITQATEGVMEGTMTPESAKAVADLTRTEIANWRARLEHARHNGKVITIPELEQTKLRKVA